MWYTDSDRLEEILHFRGNVPIREYFKHLASSSSLPIGLKFAKSTHIAKLFPHVIKFVMWVLSMSPEHGTQWWVKHNITKRLNAYYGGIEAFRSIPDWEGFDTSHNSSEVVRLNHGYDESKELSDLDLSDMRSVAHYRGGECMSDSMEKGDMDTKLAWRCACGHEFEASPRLILLGGHWCEECFPYPYGDVSNPRPWQWDREAKHNPFFAQIWKPLHNDNEDNRYGYEIFSHWEKR